MRAKHEGLSIRRANGEGKVLSGDVRVLQANAVRKLRLHTSPRETLLRFVLIEKKHVAGGVEEQEE